MPKFPEIIQTRAPAGTVLALDELARAEGKKPGDLVREAVAARLKAARNFPADTSQAA